MSFIISVFVVFFIFSTSVAQTREWENLKIVGLNKEKYHVSVIPYVDLKSAIDGDKTKSTYYQSLNGIWKFHKVLKPSDTIPSFYLPEFNVNDWIDIQVPGNQEQEKTISLDLPAQINNLVYPPFVSQINNPVCSYRKAFTVAEDWSQREIFINLDGVASAFYLWINGRKVGYSENSYSPAEFNITKYLKQGENIVSVQVFKYSDGSYLENETPLGFQGIFRTIYLYSTPKLQIRDFKVETDFDSDYKNASIKVKGEVRNLDKKDLYKYSVEFALYDAKGKEVFKEKSPLFSFAKTKSKTKGVNYEKLVIDPKKWNTENPYLYTLVITMWSDKEMVLEILSSKVGFREIEIKNNRIYNNGKPLHIRGVNYLLPHQYETPQILTEQIKLWKQCNINIIHTPHILSPEWYSLCDEYGLYVWDGASIEPSQLKRGFKSDSNWITPLMDRCYSLIETNKNHPCVISRTIGDNTLFKDNHIKMSAWIYEHDKTRPLNDSIPGSWSIFKEIETAGRTTPELEAYKYSIQPIKVIYSDLVNKKLVISNLYESTNLSEIDATWELKEGETFLQSGSLKLDIWPGEEKEVIIPFKNFNIKPSMEYWLFINFRTRKSSNWANKSHEIARERLKLPEKLNGK